MKRLQICALLAVLGLTVSAFGGCTGAPSAVETPSTDAAGMAAEALEMYDADGNGALAGEELSSIPAIELFLSEYDQNGDKQVSEDELAGRFERIFTTMGLARFTCTIFFNGQPLDGAEVVFEPEPFLGDAFKTGQGTTRRNGVTKIAVPDEELPEANRGLSGIYSGLYKVTISHPTTNIPAAYQGEDTVLGYEVNAISNAGTQAVFRLDSKGRKPQSGGQIR